MFIKLAPKKSKNDSKQHVCKFIKRVCGKKGKTGPPLFTLPL